MSAVAAPSPLPLGIGDDAFEFVSGLLLALDSDARRS
jgi:hypothetical protein